MATTSHALRAATGNNVRICGINIGLLIPGKDAHIVLLAICVNGIKTDPLDALRYGDIAAVTAVVTDGVFGTAFLYVSTSPSNSGRLRRAF